MLRQVLLILLKHLGKSNHGDESEVFDKGKMLIAAANPDMMESMIDEGDIVILGNRYESQLCAIEMEAKCLIICEGQRYQYNCQGCKEP